MKKNNKTLNHTSNYLSQMIENNFLLRINYLNKKNYSNAFYLKKKYLFIKNFIASEALIISVLIELGWTGNLCLLLLVILLMASAWCVYELSNYLKI